MVSRKVRGDTELPVIDIANGKLLESFDGLESVKIRFEDGAVVISPIATDLRKLERTARLRQRLHEGQPLAVGSVSTGLGILALAMPEGLEAERSEERRVGKWCVRTLRYRWSTDE